MMHNVNTDEKNRKSPAHFDPYTPRKPVVRDKQHGFAVMRALFAPASMVNANADKPA